MQYCCCLLCCVTLQTVSAYQTLWRQQLEQEQLNGSDNLAHPSPSSFFSGAEARVPRASLQDGVVAFIPGIVPDRVPSVLAAIRWLKKQAVPMECFVYQYTKLGIGSDAFSPCQVILHEGYWMDHIREVPLNLTKMRYVLHIMDGVTPHASLPRIIKTMAENSLVHAAPALNGKCQWEPMLPQLGFGRFVNFIEFHFDVFSREAFACLQDVVSQPPLNHFGWGVDSALPIICSGNRGVIDVMRTQKIYTGSYNARQAEDEMWKWWKAHMYSEVNPKVSLGPLQGVVESHDLQSTRCIDSASDLLQKRRGAEEADSGLANGAIDAEELEWSAALHAIARVAAAERRWSVNAVETPWNVVRQFIVPLVIFVVGAPLHLVEKTRVASKLFLFCSSQSFMNLYMKAVLSKFVVSNEQHLYGFPAGFLATGLQQMVSFVVLAILIILSQVTPWHYRPKVIETWTECGMLALLSLCFTLNIALSNFSLSMLDVSIHQVIRSISPVTTLIIQHLFFRAVGASNEYVGVRSAALMVFGTGCAILAVIAKGKGIDSASSFGSHTLGSVACLVSLFPAAMELVAVSAIGHSCKLNPIDTTLYMSLPVVIFLFAPAFLIPHATNWTGHVAPMTDFAIAMEVIRSSPACFTLAMLAGVFALFYNVLLYSVVQNFAPTISVCASTVNKSVVCLVAFIFGFDLFPKHPWGIIMIIGIIGSIGSFTLYGYEKMKGAAEAAAAVAAPAKLEKRP